eukprot:TRINITY_DN24661_c0_g1_i1.p1 TRINITY_DN24661_c0_g1~~TRINITY_DN24661_c0_g1_i1.p1  ORF type:complete len:423 (+),score=49.75 TRINITY_DN24661_c0_g1_i1:91-1269(+)
MQRAAEQQPNGRSTPDPVAALTGKEVEILSRAQVRYRGTLSHVDPATNAVTLLDVRIFGTEDRQAQHIYPGQDVLVPKIVFLGSEVTRVQVVAGQQRKVQEEAPQSTRGPFSFPDFMAAAAREAEPRDDWTGGGPGRSWMEQEAESAAARAHPDDYQRVYDHREYDHRRQQDRLRDGLYDRQYERLYDRQHEHPNDQRQYDHRQRQLPPPALQKDSPRWGQWGIAPPPLRPHPWGRPPTRWDMDPYEPVYTRGSGPGAGPGWWRGSQCGGRPRGSWGHWGLEPWEYEARPNYGPPGPWGYGPPPPPPPWWRPWWDDWDTRSRRSGRSWRSGGRSVRSRRSSRSRRSARSAHSAHSNRSWRSWRDFHTCDLEQERARGSYKRHGDGPGMGYSW